MNKQEQKFTIEFRHWLKKNPMPSSVFELKHTRGKSYLPFNEVKEHQLNALLAVESNNGFLYKISDDSIGAKPFDMFFLKKTKAFICIKYPLFFAIIPVKSFIKEKETSDRKSLTDVQAKRLSEI